MAILNSIAAWWMKKRMHQIELFMKYPHDVQADGLVKLLSTAKNTEWGKKYRFNEITDYSTFAQRIPLQDYETIKVDIERTRRGEQNILWPSETKWFAKSSGTTSDRSKFIPVTSESLEQNHFNGGRDMVAIYCSNHPTTNLFNGKNIGLAGSYQVQRFDTHESYQGDLSAIVVQNLPFWANLLRAPALSIALLDEWEEKLEKMSLALQKENITSIAGVPSWFLVLIRRVLEMNKTNNIKDVWPNLEVFFHGGVNFGPYKSQYNQIFPKGQINYQEIYNASEGFFGIQDQVGESELLLMLDYGVFYEFIPLAEDGVVQGPIVDLTGVKVNQNYAMVISTSGGLWRYQIGDTVRFTSLSPCRIKISGRTKHFINAFGEELIVENAERAIAIACEKTGAMVNEFTACPVFFGEDKNGAHEWLIEFERAPEDLEYFGELMDNALKALNSDYEAKRYHNFVLKAPIIQPLKKGVFFDWLRNNKKVGAQTKIPRLSNNRDFVEEIKRMLIVFLIVLSVGSIKGYGQETDSKLPDKAPLFTSIEVLPNSILLEVDNLDNFYTVTSEGVIRKYNSTGSLLNTYSNKTYGEIYALDVSNPMKILVFYRDFQKVVYLDDNLNQNGEPIDLQLLGYTNITAAAMGNENGLWLFNGSANELVKLNQYLQPINQSGNLSNLLDGIIVPNTILEVNGQLFLSDAQKGLICFDVYGTYIKTVPVFGLHSFQLIGNLLYWTESNAELYLDLKTKASGNFELPKASFLTVKIGSKHWFGLQSNQVFIYSK